MRGARAKALRRIARERTKGLPECDYYVGGGASRLGQMWYCIRLATGCTRDVYQRLKRQS